MCINLDKDKDKTEPIKNSMLSVFVVPQKFLAFYSFFFLSSFFPSTCSDTYIKKKWKQKHWIKSNSRSLNCNVTEIGSTHKMWTREREGERERERETEIDGEKERVKKGEEIEPESWIKDEETSLRIVFAEHWKSFSSRKIDCISKTANKFKQVIDQFKAEWHQCKSHET